MSAEENKQIVRRFIEEAINKGDVEAAGAYVAEDVVEQVPFPGQGPGLSGLKGVLRNCSRPSPTCAGASRSKSPKPIRCSRASLGPALTRRRFSAFPLRKGRSTVWGMVIDRLEHGKIKETRILMDALGLMRQLDG